MIIKLLIYNAVALLLYMTIIFLVSRARKRLDTVDAAWGGAFLVAGCMVAGLEPHIRTGLIAVLIFIWATRLSSHIIERSRKRGEDDQRYTEIAAKWGKQNYWLRAYLSIFLVQGLMALIVSIPTVFAAGKPLASAALYIIAGAIIWAIGFVIEVIGDRQLQHFLANKANKGKVLDYGLWHYTRHPNYLGEITQWYGIGVIACSTRLGFIGLLGPIVLTIVIRFVSGVPPIEKRKSKDPAYARYMQHTGAILPKFASK